MDICANFKVKIGHDKVKAEVKTPKSDEILILQVVGRIDKLKIFR